MRQAEIAGISARSQLNRMEEMQEIGWWALKNIQIEKAPYRRKNVALPLLCMPLKDSNSEQHKQASKKQIVSILKACIYQFGESVDTHSPIEIVQFKPIHPATSQFWTHFDRLWLVG